MQFKEPSEVYIAATNLEAHLIVEMLQAQGIGAYAVEDNTGPSLWMFGTISQFHHPIVWVEKSDVEAAGKLIAEYEEKNRERRQAEEKAGEVEVVCEECGFASMFSGKLMGTVQECSHCHAYVDVGECDWNEDFGEGEE